ncbi:DUF11 domain-containing protein [Paenibacillus sp. P25]|nr:DUF11 domain-containing protein [Paenibacillus sp. P25]
MTAGDSGSSGVSTAPAQPQITLNLSVDKNIVEEGDPSHLTIHYGNQSTSMAVSGTVKVTLPAGVEMIDADGGTVDGRTITWKVKDLATGKSGSFNLTVKWPQTPDSADRFRSAGSVYSRWQSDPSGRLCKVSSILQPLRRTQASTLYSWISGWRIQAEAFDHTRRIGGNRGPSNGE